MKYKYLVITLISFAISSIIVAQNNFKEGYIINNKHIKINCLIRNTGNEESAMNYEYRLSENKPIEKINLSKIKEFGINNQLKCRRALITIDVSKDFITNPNDTITKWETGYAYVKTLVEGESASLYSYYFQDQPIFFYSLGGQSIKPLIHKEYEIASSSILHQNIIRDNTYQEQLKEDLSCNNAKNDHKISYTKKDLVKYFINYNNCKKSDYQTFESAQVYKGMLFIKPSIFLNSSQLSMKEPVDAEQRTFFEKINGVSFGVELEYMIPYNNYIWSFFTEANYVSYNTDKLSLENTQSADSKKGRSINIKSIEIPIGVTYNINLNQNQRLYVKGAIVPHFITSDSHLILIEGGEKKKLSSSYRFLAGLGYTYKNIGLEVRYNTPHNVTRNIEKRGSNFTQLSMKLSYSFQLMGDKRTK